MTVSELQRALAARGFDPGPIDGALGRRTATAIAAFQAANGVSATGIADPATEALLAPAGGAGLAAADPLQALALPWFVEAQRCLGIKEDTGPGSNPLIIGWGKALRIAYSDDETPWCGLFVAHCIGSQLTAEPLPANPLGARNWGRFGVACPVPQPGAVMVFWRESTASGKGHVAFYVGEDDSAFHVLGGNQSNAVSVTRMPRARFLGARWPVKAPPPAGAPRRLRPDGRLSDNEQ